MVRSLPGPQSGQLGVSARNHRGACSQQSRLEEEQRFAEAVADALADGVNAIELRCGSCSSHFHAYAEDSEVKSHARTAQPAAQSVR